MACVTISAATTVAWETPSLHRNLADRCSRGLRVPQLVTGHLSRKKERRQPGRRFVQGSPQPHDIAVRGIASQCLRRLEHPIAHRLPFVQHLQDSRCNQPKNVRPRFEGYAWQLHWSTEGQEVIRRRSGDYARMTDNRDLDVNTQPTFEPVPV